MPLTNIELDVTVDHGARTFVITNSSQAAVKLYERGIGAWVVDGTVRWASLFLEESIVEPRTLRPGESMTLIAAQDARGGWTHCRKDDLAPGRYEGGAIVTVVGPDGSNTYYRTNLYPVQFGNGVVRFVSDQPIG